MRVEDCYTLSQIIRSAIAGGLDPEKMEISVEVLRAGGVLPPEKVSLRDHFAGQAMQGCMAGIPWESNGQPLPVQEAADYALLSYQIADAMLKARGGAA